MVVPSEIQLTQMTDARKQEPDTHTIQRVERLLLEAWSVFRRRLADSASQPRFLLLEDESLSNVLSAAAARIGWRLVVPSIVIPSVLGLSESSRVRRQLSENSNSASITKSESDLRVETPIDTKQRELGSNGVSIPNLYQKTSVQSSADLQIIGPATQKEIIPDDSDLTSMTTVTEKQELLRLLENPAEHLIRKSLAQLVQTGGSRGGGVLVVDGDFRLNPVLLWELGALLAKLETSGAREILKDSDRETEADLQSKPPENFSIVGLESCR